MSSLEKKIEQVLEEKVRPRLADHSGNVEVISIEDQTVTVRFTGQCSGCPSACITIEEVVKKEILNEIPEIKDVRLDTGITEDMMAFAKSFLNQSKGKKERCLDGNR